MCKDGAACQRRVCFFAHSAAELRSTGTKASTAGTEGGSAEEEAVSPSAVDVLADQAHSSAYLQSERTDRRRYGLSCHAITV